MANENSIFQPTSSQTPIPEVSTSAQNTNNSRASKDALNQQLSIFIEDRNEPSALALLAFLPPDWALELKKPEDSAEKNLLKRAVKMGLHHLMQQFISMGVDIREADKNGEILLHYAAFNGHLEAIKILLSAAPDTINAKSRTGETPLHKAVRTQNIEVINFLIQNGADLNAEYQESFTSKKFKPLDIAREINNSSLLLMLDNRTPVEKFNINVISAILSRNQIFLLNLLTQAPVSWNINTHYYELFQMPRANLLLVAAQLGMNEVVVKLFSMGAFINTASANGETPLHKAVRSGNQNIVKFLIENGADINAEYEDPETHKKLKALDVAKQINNLVLVSLLENHVTPYQKIIDLLKSGDEVKALELIENYSFSDMKISSFLSLAAEKGMCQFIQKIFSKYPLVWSYINRSLENGETLLHKAVRSGNLNSVKFFIHNLANPNIEYEDPVRHKMLKPIDIAREANHFLIISYLENIMDPEIFSRNIQNAMESKDEWKVLDLLTQIPYRWQTSINGHPKPFRAYATDLLIVAAEKGMLKVIDMLLRFEADIKKKSGNGETALHKAIRSRHIAIVEFLISQGALDIEYEEMLSSDSFKSLDIAKEINDASIILLLENKKALQKFNYNIMRALESGNEPTLLELLNDTPALWNINDNYYKLAAHAHYTNLLMLTAEKGMYNAVVKLVEMNAEITFEEDRLIKLPIHYAAEKGHIDIVKYLFALAPNTINIRSGQRSTPLHFAIKSANLALIQFLIINGADLHIKSYNTQHKTPEELGLNSANSSIQKYFSQLKMHPIKVEAIPAINSTFTVKSVGILIKNWGNSDFILDGVLIDNLSIDPFMLFIRALTMQKIKVPRLILQNISPEAANFLVNHINAIPLTAFVIRNTPDELIMKLIQPLKFNTSIRELCIDCSLQMINVVQQSFQNNKNIRLVLNPVMRSNSFHMFTPSVIAIPAPTTTASPNNLINTSTHTTSNMISAHNVASAQLKRKLEQVLEYEPEGGEYTSEEEIEPAKKARKLEVTPTEKRAPISIEEDMEDEDAQETETHLAHHNSSSKDNLPVSNISHLMTLIDANKVQEAIELLNRKILSLDELNNYFSDSKRNAIMLAAEKGLIEIIKTLIDHGVDPCKKNEDGYTSFHFAAIRADINIIKFLRPYFSDLNIETTEGLTALYYAVTHKDFPTVKELISNGAIVDLDRKFLFDLGLLDFCQKNSPIYNYLLEHSHNQKKQSLSLASSARLALFSENAVQVSSALSSAVVIKPDPMAQFDIEEAKEVIKILRGNSNEQENCTALVDDFNQYLYKKLILLYPKEEYMPKNPSSIEPSTEEHMHFFLEFGYLPRKSGTLYRAAVSSTIDLENIQFKNIPLLTEVPSTPGGTIEADKPLVINVSDRIQESALYHELNNKLMRHASNRISFGIVTMGFGGNYVGEYGHMLCYVAIANDVWYIDPSRYNGMTGKGLENCIFHNLGDCYQFGDSHRLDAKTFSALVFYTPIKFKPSPILNQPQIKEEPEEMTSSQSSMNPSQ